MLRMKDRLTEPRIGQTIVTTTMKGCDSSEHRCDSSEHRCDDDELL